MLYLHCGWPKTGTTSLQAALVKHEDRLSAAGMLYPEEWRAGKLNHHRLPSLLDEGSGSADPLDAFRRFLAACDCDNVLFSAEGMTHARMPAERTERLLRLVAAAQELMPTRCIWTLRRFDEQVNAVYLQWLHVAHRFPPQLAKRLPPHADLDKVWDVAEVFTGLRTLEDRIDDVVWIKYDGGGAHNQELLRAFDLEGAVGDAILEELREGPRRNVSFTHKKAVALIYREALAERAEADLHPGVLRQVFRDGFEFEEDRRCALVGAEAMRSLHARALAAARRVGFAPYSEFFADDRVSGPADPGFTPDSLSDQDLERLVARVGAGQVREERIIDVAS